ncbi:hypothetical protein PF008_g14357 [Phytophthora fragariae]|uniref:Uncharacterized protein n=1 Tax=Phytophthora fragariae TaxID=53985 RepID=A0A6G0RH82_9STRA|nr:hypothetical protein PF008_g14357 [Phytophthora fragariae]
MLRLNDFLDDFSADCTIADAYKRTNSVRLMQYVAAREDPDEMDPFYRRWLFNKTTEMAAARGDLQSLQWLVESYLPDEFLTKAVAAAAANGHLPVLEWLFERHRDRGYWGNTEMCGALTNGHVKVVEWLRTHAAPRSECLAGTSQRRTARCRFSSFCTLTRSAVRGIPRFGLLRGLGI